MIKIHLYNWVSVWNLNLIKIHFCTTITTSTDCEVDFCNNENCVLWTIKYTPCTHYVIVGNIHFWKVILNSDRTFKQGKHEIILLFLTILETFTETLWKFYLCVWFEIYYVTSKLILTNKFCVIWFDWKLSKMNENKLYAMWLINLWTIMNQSCTLCC